MSRQPAPSGWRSRRIHELEAWKNPEESQTSRRGFLKSRNQFVAIVPVLSQVSLGESLKTEQPIPRDYR
jgi:hypothetical protein